MTSLNSVGIALELTKLIGRKDFTRGVILENEWAGDNNPSRFFVFTHKDNGHHNGYFEYNGKIRNCSIIDDKESKTNIIGHPATLSDFHRFLNEWMTFPKTNDRRWFHSPESIALTYTDKSRNFYIPYDSYKDILDQDEGVLKQIVSLINETYTNQ